MKRFFPGLLTLSIIWMLAGVCISQTSRGTLTGTVTDSSGAVIPKAAVKFTEVNTNVSRQTTTNDAGIYRFDAVDLGTYTVSVSVVGFASENQTGVEVQAAHTRNLDFSLKVGTAKEIVTVEGAAGTVALQTSEQVRGENFSTQSIATLPVVAGDSLTLTQLLPGVALGSFNSINQ